MRPHALLVCLLAAAPAAADPRIDYMLQCQGCHGPEGLGLPGAVPALRGQVARLATWPAGREYLVRVPGVAQSPLRDAALAEVLTWMVREFGPADAAAASAPFLAEEVARHRARPLVDVEPVRRALLLELESR